MNRTYRRLRRLALLPAVAALAVSTTATAQPPGNQIVLKSAAAAWNVPRSTPYKTMTLPNGLEVVVIEDHTAPLVTVDVTVRNGAFTEPDEFAGLSHLYEHMFFKANASLPSQELFMKRVRELGIVFNGYTSEDVVTYFFTLPSRNLEPGVKFMADAIRTPLFDSTELTKEREVVLGEFDRNEARPEFVLFRAIDSAVWMPYVSRKQPLGQRLVIKTATIEKMKMIQERFYMPNNSALIVAGDIDPEKVFALAKKYFESWEPGDAPFPTYAPPAFPPLKSSKLVVREAKVPDAVLSLDFHGPSIGRDEPMPYIGQLISTLLRQPTSRFRHNLIDSGLVTEVWGGYDNARNTGTFGFGGRAPKEKAMHALAVLKNEIRAMGRPGYFTAEELATAKQIIADRQLFERDNFHSFAIQTTARWWSMASLDYYLDFPANVQRITENQIIEFINRYATDKPFVLAIGAQQDALNAMNITEEAALRW